ncbi:MAG TPA: hypothetical protein PKK26_04380, partial [Candidatus Wallbacteria bacterium]|nr:hypothetical protein [Candidatus Wallbacteria bacterium]
MLKKSLLLLLSLSVIINLFTLVVINDVYADDTVYSRNGEVYVMIGEGTRMGVYANQKIVNGVRGQPQTDGFKLFGDGVTLDPATGEPKMNSYESLAVDQFRNIYVLAGKLDHGLINLTDPKLKDKYFPVDPPEAEGIVGFANVNGEGFHDVLNHCDNPTRSLHDAQPQKFTAQSQKAVPDDHFCAVQATFPLANSFAPPLPPAAIKANYENKYPGRTGDIRRIPLDYWYVGRLDWKTPSQVINCSNSTVTWQIKYDVKVQRINLWISHFVAPEYVPAGALVPKLALDATIVPGTVQDKFEDVFNTTNTQYKRRRATGCGEAFHPGALNETTVDIKTGFQLGFTTTGAGRRYVFSSLPEQKIKKGTIRLVSGNTFGIPQADSVDFTALDPSQLKNGKLDTFSMGAATKNAIDDYVYTSPWTYDGWEVIGFAVADQWDGAGGVRYMLLQEPGGNQQFDPTKEKKIRWDKMKGYIVDSGGIIKVDKDVKAIAGDGSGSL